MTMEAMGELVPQLSPRGASSVLSCKGMGIPPKEGSCLWLRKAQITGANFEQLTTCAQPGEREKWVRARGEDQVEVGRQMIERKEQPFVDGLFRDEMEVIQDQDDFPVKLHDHIEQSHQNG